MQAIYDNVQMMQHSSALSVSSPDSVCVVNVYCEMQEVGVMQMQWNKPCAVQPDIILAADVLYDPGEFCRHFGLAC